MAEDTACNQESAIKSCHLDAIQFSIMLQSTLKIVPSVNDLPDSPRGKNGWPWTESKEVTFVADSKFLPTVTVVTPSYNQAQFIEETIRSVLLQGYPKLEYIIMDGGSTDGSIEIIRKYAPWLAFWVSAPDRGQVDAVTKGWARGTGEIIAYLNSDDTYMPGAIHAAVNALLAHPSAPAICGGELQIDGDGMVIAEKKVKSATQIDLLSLHFIPQPSVFLRRSAFDQTGGFDHSVQTSFDFELWTRMSRLGEFKCIPQVLAATRWHSSTKTLTRRLVIASELQTIIRRALANHREFPVSIFERLYIRARLRFVLLSICLDHPSQRAREIVTNFILVAVLWPPIIFSMTWLGLSALIHHSILFYLRVIKHKNIEQLKAIHGRTGIHWSQWKSARK